MIDVQRMNMRLSRARKMGQIYGWVYKAQKPRVLGMRIGLIILFILLLLIPWAYLSDWGIPLTVAAAVPGMMIVLIYLLASANGYITFSETNRPEPAPGGKPAAVYDRVRFLATGRFSTRQETYYQILSEGQYWRIPVGEHVFMVKGADDRFAYDFVVPSALESVRAGRLIHGRNDLPSLEVTFDSSWAPEFGEEQVFRMIPQADSANEALDRRAYLSFKDEDDMQLVWQSLLSSENL